MSSSGKQRAPTLYIIISIKLIKAFILLMFALGVYALIDENLPETFTEFVRWVHLDPEKKFFSDLGTQIEKITPDNVRFVAIGTLIYSLFSLIEGIGLIYRVTWAGWLAIGESAFFIPIEILDLIHDYSFVVLVILFINIVIVSYLYKNRKRLFHPWHHGGHPPA